MTRHKGKECIITIKLSGIALLLTVAALFVLTVAVAYPKPIASIGWHDLASVGWVTAPG